MTSKRKLSLCVAMFGFALLCSSASFGQEIRRYQPRKPTISPYLDLLRFNDGGLPNYYSWVRPRKQQRAFNTESRAWQRQQTITLGRVTNEFQKNRRAIAPTGTGSWFMNDSAGSTFLNTSRFYPGAAPVTRRR